MRPRRALAALAVALLPLVRAECPDTVDPSNPDCSSCQNQAAAESKCVFDFTCLYIYNGNMGPQFCEAVETQCPDVCSSCCQPSLCDSKLTCGHDLGRMLGSQIRAP